MRSAAAYVVEGNVVNEELYVSFTRHDAMWASICLHDITLEEPTFFEIRVQMMFLVLVARGTPCEFVAEKCRMAVVSADRELSAITFVFKTDGQPYYSEWTVPYNQVERAIAAIL